MDNIDITKYLSLDDIYISIDGGPIYNARTGKLLKDEKSGVSDTVIPASK